MTERLVLHPAADLVDAAVGDPHDMERVGDPAGVIEVRGQAGPERLGQIGGHHLDPGQPRRVGVGGPSPQVSGSVAFDHVDHDVPLEIDQPGRVDRGVVPVGGQERRLVDPELADRTDPVGVVDQRGAVLDDGVHDRPPTHPELVGELATPGGRSHRPGGTPRPRPAGSAPPARRHARSVSVHVLRRAQRLAATPPPLAPHQPGRPPEAGQIADVDRHPILRLGPHPARPTERSSRRRLDRDHDLAVASRSPRAPGTRAVPTAPRPDRYRRSSSGVSSSSQPSDSRNDGETPDSRGGCSATPSPLQREEPDYQGRRAPGAAGVASLADVDPAIAERVRTSAGRGARRAVNDPIPNYCYACVLTS